MRRTFCEIEFVANNLVDVTRTQVPHPETMHLASLVDVCRHTKRESFDSLADDQ